MDYYRLNELPDTYKRCKKYTDHFEGWLLETAKKRGLEIAAYAEANAKEAENKEHRKKSSRHGKPYKILMKDLKAVAEAVASSGKPLRDTSGLTDLDDAIRTRKEITEFYRFYNESDEEHPFFIGVLSDVRDVLKGWLCSIPIIAKDHDIEDNSSKVANITVVYNFGNTASQEDGNEGVRYDDASEIGPKGEEACRPRTKVPGNAESTDNQKSKKGLRSKGSNVVPLSPDESELEREFQVLCFLYDLTRLRDCIKQVWIDWKYRKIGAMTASIVSDLAQGIIRQNVMALAEDLEDNADDQKILTIIRKIHKSCPYETKEDATSSGTSTVPDGSQEQYINDPLCLAAIDCMEDYWRIKQSDPGGDNKEPDEAFSVMTFLQYFDRIRRRDLRVPVLDNFTESICSPKARSELWLPFGLCILFDIQEVVHDKHRDIYNEVVEHGIHMADVIKAHMDYEDSMWDAGNKPDYMSVGGTKFSNIFLGVLQRLLDWLKQLSGMYDVTSEKDVHEMDNRIFLAMHPILGGLVMHHYQTHYNEVGVQKISWFIIGLAHLYNACVQIGGLASGWEDLDFIINTHGAARIFIGGPPTDPNFFYKRFLMASSTSSRCFGSDYQGKWRKSSRKIEEKRGPMTHLPLEDMILQYYLSPTSDKRWIILHNIFAHLRKDDEKRRKQFPGQISEHIDGETLFLQDLFNSIATTITPKPKNRKQRKKGLRVKAPDFSKLDCVHRRLLLNMCADLRDHELHASFDYLSFFRRAYALVTRIREDILWDNAMQISTLGVAFEDPPNFTLLCDLFEGLQIRPKEEDIETDGNELSKDVVPLDKLKKIALTMQDMICEEGDAELRSAKKQMRRQWNKEQPPVANASTGRLVDGVYHRFAYSSTMSRKQRKIGAWKLLQLRLAAGPPREDARHRLVGARKHHILFECLGQCAMDRDILDYVQSRSWQSGYVLLSTS